MAAHRSHRHDSRQGGRSHLQSNFQLRTFSTETKCKVNFTFGFFLYILKVGAISSNTNNFMEKMDQGSMPMKSGSSMGIWAAVVVVIILVVVGVVYASNKKADDKAMMTKDTMMQKDTMQKDTMQKEGDTMMPKDSMKVEGSMDVQGDTMMKQ